jgi:hypothetical protein
MVSRGETQTRRAVIDQLRVAAVRRQPAQKIFAKDYDISRLLSRRWLSGICG